MLHRLARPRAMTMKSLSASAQRVQDALNAAGIETTIAIIATGTGVTGPIGPLETGPIIAPVPLLSRAITPARLILVTLSVARVDHRVEAANDVANPLRGTGLCREHPGYSEYRRTA